MNEQLLLGLVIAAVIAAAIVARMASGESKATHCRGWRRSSTRF